MGYIKSGYPQYTVKLCKCCTTGCGCIIYMPDQNNNSNNNKKQNKTNKKTTNQPYKKTHTIFLFCTLVVICQRLGMFWILLQYTCLVLLLGQRSVVLVMERLLD